MSIYQRTVPRSSWKELLADGIAASAVIAKLIDPGPLEASSGAQSLAPYTCESHGLVTSIWCASNGVPDRRGAVVLTTFPPLRGDKTSRRATANCNGVRENVTVNYDWMVVQPRPPGYTVYSGWQKAVTKIPVGCVVTAP